MITLLQNKHNNKLLLNEKSLFDLDSQLDIDQKDERGRPLQQFHIYPDRVDNRNYVKIIKLLINEKALIQKNQDGDNPLIYALKKRNDNNIIKLLINDKVINEKNQDGDTPLMYALQNKLNYNIIKLLINDKALNQKDINGDIPLIYALRNRNDYKIVKLLIND